MTSKDLSNINAITRKMVSESMEKKNITLNAFARGSGVHQNQLWLYMNSGDESKGLHSKTMEKIGKFINSK